MAAENAAEMQTKLRTFANIQQQNKIVILFFYNSL